MHSKCMKFKLVTLSAWVRKAYCDSKNFGMRLLLVALPGLFCLPLCTRKVLWSAKKLAYSKEYDEVSIAPDLTASQWKRKTELRKEIRSRKEKGRGRTIYEAGLHLQKSN